MDITDLKYPDQYFDIVLDKGNKMITFYLNNNYYYF